jgi:FkbM family methyltransferase
MQFLARFFSIGCMLFLNLFFLGSLEANFAQDLHVERLQFLKDKGFKPKVVYDIGAFRGYWTAEIKQIYNEANFYLFEANENNKYYLDQLGLPYFCSLLGDKEQMISFFTNNSTGDSIFCEQTVYYQGQNCSVKQLPMTTLAKIVGKNNLPKPDLIKIDVQGAEKLIIQGSPDIIMNAEVVILETKILEYNQKAPLVNETLSLMCALGFSLMDILECHYLPTGELNEIDLLFVKNDSKLIKKGILIE